MNMNLSDILQTVSETVVSLKTFSPLHVLLAFAGCALLVHLMNRSRESLLIACTAAAYAIPFMLGAH